MRGNDFVNILCLHNENYVGGGADRFFLDLVELVRTRHHAIQFCVGGPREGAAAEDTYEVKVGKSSFSQGLFRLGGTFYSQRSRRALTQLLTAESVDVAHVHNWYSGLSMSVLFELRRRKIPLVQTLHDYKLICPTWRLLAGKAVCERCKGGRYYHCLFQDCAGGRTKAALHVLEHYWSDWLGWDALVAKYLAPSRFLMEKLISFGFNREKMVHLPYFIDSSRFKVVTQKGDYVIFAGRLSHEKGVDVLVEAMRHVRGLRCIVAGDGPERPRIEALARSLDLPIEFTGFLTRAQLFPLIGGARALVLPSLWYENQPVSVLEA
jgi:glycosyltransferase involved in cell wall biosynthesis